MVVDHDTFLETAIGSDHALGNARKGEKAIEQGTVDLIKAFEKVNGEEGHLLTREESLLDIKSKVPSGLLGSPIGEARVHGTQSPLLTPTTQMVQPHHAPTTIKRGENLKHTVREGFAKLGGLRFRFLKKHRLTEKKLMRPGRAMLNRIKQRRERIKRTRR
ncbi:MAG: hypothetical protein GY721_11885 [Deltaproteobacteria bacterium]|nr:hypothetical protein [Deltaproteobacteria bacterium]